LCSGQANRQDDEDGVVTGGGDGGAKRLQKGESHVDA
jgi:hypothetical protein